MLVDGELVALMRDIKAIGDIAFVQLSGCAGQPPRYYACRCQPVHQIGNGQRMFSAKDFRTWGGTLQAAIALAEMGKPENEKAD